MARIRTYILFSENLSLDKLLAFQDEANTDEIPIEVNIQSGQGGFFRIVIHPNCPKAMSVERKLQTVETLSSQNIVNSLCQERGEEYRPSRFAVLRRAVETADIVSCTTW